MHADIVAGDVEADAAARLRAVIGCRLIKAIEDVGFVFVGYALAGIGYSDSYSFLLLVERQRDAAACGCEFQGVGDGVPPPNGGAASAQGAFSLKLTINN